MSCLGAYNPVPNFGTAQQVIGLAVPQSILNKPPLFIQACFKRALKPIQAQMAGCHQCSQPAVTSTTATIFHSEIDGVENNSNLQGEDSFLHSWSQRTNHLKTIYHHRRGAISEKHEIEQKKSVF